MIEQILRDAAAADAEVSAVLLRYFNPIGAHESGLIGEQPQGIPNNLMPYLCQVAAGKLPQLRVFGDDYPTPDGTGVRDYIHVVDLAKGHAAALAYAASHQGAEVFNLGTGRGSSVMDLIRSFERVNGIKIPYAIAPRRRHRRVLGRRLESRAPAELEGAEIARRHVPRFLELDEEVAAIKVSKGLIKNDVAPVMF
ncbi:NAD-dependent epimerase/dehydratase family protein [Pyramidobacter sp. YE332]|nr:NAD-dependent epimerase/dehydratase family protein [Pyramidobacter sp. YE332]WOL38961.1 NAD-dependent epimerase/dehydratase family protein [Pyramidobacter sp. YE332]